MGKVYRIGIIGFAHSHITTLGAEFAKLPNVEWVACADTAPAVPSLSQVLGTRAHSLKWAQQALGISRVYTDYREMLARERFDIVLFCPENARHAEVAEAIAAHGAHMVTEKPMAATLSDALRMARVARLNQVELMINWPTTWSPAIRAAKALIDQGTIGHVWEVKWRNGASIGPLSYVTPDLTEVEKAAEWWYQADQGGGALLDYCCYGACLSRWYVGEQAVAAYGLRANLNSQYGDAEDNAVILVHFPRAQAILEGTWTTWHVGVPTGPIIYGTRGALVLNDRTGPAGGMREVVEVYTSHRHGVTEPDEIVEGEPLPEGRTTLAEEFIHHLETGEPLHPTLDMMQNLEVVAILDAGMRSAASGDTALVDNATWCIG